MNTGFKLGLLGLVVSSVISITFGVLELKKNRRMHQDDINLIVEGVRAKTKNPKKKEEPTDPEKNKVGDN